MKKHYFLNLTNGIEYLDKNDILENEIIHFMRIRSTTIERKDFLFLLSDLDHNFLLHLALGSEVIFVDYGTNRKNSKTIYTAIPFIEYVLNRRWLGNETKPYRLTRGSDDKVFDQDEYFKHLYDNLFNFDQNKEKNKLKVKIDYFKRFLNTSRIEIKTISSSTINDGNYSLYSNIIKEKYK